MNGYNKVFTSALYAQHEDTDFDDEDNYEFYELYGDKILNSCVLKFMTRKFP